MKRARSVPAQAGEMPVIAGLVGLSLAPLTLDPHRGYVNFAQLHGKEQARKICESEAEVLSR